MIAHLKKHFYNNHNLVLEAKKHTDKGIKNNNHKNNLKNILKEGYTIEDIEKRINLKKEIAMHVLSELTNDMNKIQYKSLINTINQTTNIKILSIIIQLLNRSYCFGDKIDNEIIQNKIKYTAQIDKILFD